MTEGNWWVWAILAREYNLTPLPTGMKPLLISLAILFGFSALAQPAPPTATLDQWVNRHVAASYDELKAFLSLPSNAHLKEQIPPNLAWLKTAFRQRGFQTEELPTDGLPLFYAERRTGKPGPTLLLYMHFDGQPVVPAEWQQASPYEPVLKRRAADGSWQPMDWNALKTGYDPEWRIFGRASSDDKGPIVMLLTALDILQKEKQPLAATIKVVLDGEEEIGSPNLASAVARYKARFSADRMLIMDGPRHLSNQPTLAYGCRGIATLTLTTYGPRLPQHSGHYGNYAPNPALRLSQLLASMKDEAGRVTIPGFYDGIRLDESARQVMARVPDQPAEIHRKIEFAVPDGVGKNYQESLQYPSLNIRGLAAGGVGTAATTIVPDKAVAEIDIRLVPESDPDRLIRLVRNHIEKQGYHLTEGAPTDEERQKYPRLATLKAEVSSRAFRTEFGTDIDRWLSSAMNRAFGREPVKIRIMGGTVPIAPFIQEMNVPAVLVPLVNADNNQHAANENLRLGNYVEGVKAFLAVLTE